MIVTMHVRLVSPSNGHNWLLKVEEGRPITIGRLGAENDIVLSGPTVSRRHAQIEREGENLILVDRESTNGIRIRPYGEESEEEVIGRIEIDCGDTFFLGTVPLQVKAVGLWKEIPL